MSRRPLSVVRRVGLLVVVCGLAGIAVFGVLVWRTITVEDAGRADAERRITSVRRALPSKAPLIEIDDEGRLVRMSPTGEAAARPIGRLKALAWRAADERLVSADAPFWFFRLKAPAARYALAETGFDFDRLGLTPADLERFGPAVIIDHTSRNGSRLLVWTE